MAFTISSPAFENGQMIPVKYSCKGENVSPPLAWSGAPAGTKSFALIMDDPDAPSGIFVHWVVFNIPATAAGLGERVSPSGKLPDATIQGVNGRQATGYTGPCPPWGKHRYFFKLYALDTLLGLGSSADKRGLLGAMQGHILAEAQLLGHFSK